MGLGLHSGLLEWLNKYTFNAEKKFKCQEYSALIYEKLIQAFINNGTTTCCYFGSTHLHSNKVLADLIFKYGQRALLGKTNLTNNSPFDYTETNEESINATLQFVKYVKTKYRNTLIEPVITPRFAPGCNFKLLMDLGDIAKDENLKIQTHLSENKKEVELAESMYAPVSSYTEIYNKCNLLNSKTILAHCIHLSEEELVLIKKQNAGIVHCPNSNFSLCSGILNVPKIFEYKIKIGLGTDISAGTSLSMLDSIRQAITAAKTLTMFDTELARPLKISEVFYMATMGGAQVLNLENKIGNFCVGKEFDALVIDLEHLSDEINLLDLFECFVMTGDDRNIKEVYVRGEVINK